MTDNVKREAEIVARLEKNDYSLYLGASEVYGVHESVIDDLRYLLAQLQQARQENIRLTAEIAQDLEDYKEVSRTALSAIGEVEQERDAALQQAREEIKRQDKVISKLQNAMNPQDCADALNGE